MGEKRENRVIRKQLLLSETVYEDLKGFAGELSMSMNDLINFFVTKFLESYRGVSGTEEKSKYSVTFICTEKTKNLMLMEFSNYGIKNIEIKREEIINEDNYSD